MTQAAWLSSLRITREPATHVLGEFVCNNSS